MSISSQEAVLNPNGNAQIPASPEAVFEEIIKSSKEYTTTNVTELLLNKVKLLNVLKTHRPIKLGNYQYGFSESLRPQSRLIVFEWDDKRMCRDYSQMSDRKHLWECLKCHRLYQKQLRKSRTFLYLHNGIVFVPILYHCSPRDYKSVMEYQKLLKNGNLKAARSMIQRCDFDFKESPPPSNNDDDAKFVPTLKRRSNDADNLAAEKPPLNKKSKKRTSAETENVKIEHKSADNKLQKKTKRDKKDGSDIFAESKTVFSFKKPSSSLLKEICKKLGIKYFKEAKKVWKIIEFEKINIASKKIEISTIESKNFYKILSKFFTGKTGNFQQIFDAINAAFCNKLIAKGKISTRNIAVMCSSCYTVTEENFVFIAKFLRCKILIFDFDNNVVKMYGKWKNDNILPLILQFLNGKFSIVVNL